MPQRKIENVLRGQKLLHLPPSTTVQEAVRAMVDRHVAAVVVSESEGKLNGIFTERDVMIRVVAPGLNPTTTPLSRVMTIAPTTISAETTVREALMEMDGHNIRHLPVMEGERVIGIVSMRDFVGDEVAELERNQTEEQRFAEGLR
ncbi:CBS domain-containing protein [Azospirillaceae bacterium]